MALLVLIPAAERAAAEEFTVARLTNILAVFDNDSPARNDGLHHAFHLHPFIGAVINVHVVSRGRYGLFFIRIEDDYIGIRADGDCAFAREQSEYFCRRCRSQLDEAVQAYSPLDYAVIDQRHAMFDAWPAVWNLREIVAAKLLLLFEAERAMICRNHLQVVARKPLP